MPADLERSHCEALFTQLSVLRLRSPQREDSCEALSPSLGSLSRHWLRVRETHSEHPNDVGFRAQGEASSASSGEAGLNLTRAPSRTVIEAIPNRNNAELL